MIFFALVNLWASEDNDNDDDHDDYGDDDDDCDDDDDGDDDDETETCDVIWMKDGHASQRVSWPTFQC